MNGDITKETMEMRRRLLTGFVGALTATSSLIPLAPAGAASNVNWSSGSYVRQRIWENYNGGAAITVFGSAPCTATLSDTETVMRYMNDYGWNDVASAANSYNACDLRIYKDVNLSGDFKGYTWYSSASPVYFGDVWNDLASSFALS